MTHAKFNNTSREGWETNSSSSHSLVLDPDAKSVLRKTADFGTVKDGVLTIHGKSTFGWEWEIWDAPDEKINYLLIDGFNAEHMERLLIEHLDGVKKVVFCVNDENKASYDCYIDHQSIGTSSEIHDLDDEGIWAFITNPANMLRGGNDNSEGPW